MPSLLSWPKFLPTLHSIHSAYSTPARVPSTPLSLLVIVQLCNIPLKGLCSEGAVVYPITERQLDHEGFVLTNELIF